MTDRISSLPPVQCAGLTVAVSLLYGARVPYPETGVGPSQSCGVELTFACPMHYPLPCLPAFFGVCPLASEVRVRPVRVVAKRRATRGAQPARSRRPGAQHSPPLKTSVRCAGAAPGACKYILGPDACPGGGLYCEDTVSFPASVACDVCWSRVGVRFPLRWWAQMFDDPETGALCLDCARHMLKVGPAPAGTPAPRPRAPEGSHNRLFTDGTSCASPAWIGDVCVCAWWSDLEGGVCA